MDKTLKRKSEDDLEDSRPNKKQRVEQEFAQAVISNTGETLKRKREDDLGDSRPNKKQRIEQEFTWTIRAVSYNILRYYGTDSSYFNYTFRL